MLFAIFLNKLESALNIGLRQEKKMKKIVLALATATMLLTSSTFAAKKAKAK